MLQKYFIKDLNTRVFFELRKNFSKRGYFFRQINVKFLNISPALHKFSQGLQNRRFVSEMTSSPQPFHFWKHEIVAGGACSKFTVVY